MEPVRWGVLGIGRHFILRTLMSFQKSEKSALAGAASRDPEKARRAEEEYGIPRGYAPYEALLDDPSVEAVYITLPNHLHTEWIRKAADAGKHILCEKPMALTAVEARDAAAYARSKGVLLSEAFMYRYHPRWVRARELALTGHIGSLRAIHTLFGYYNADPANIRNVREYGGGALYDIGCYAVSLSRYLTGREPGSVFARITRDPATGTDILTSAVLDFGEARAQFTVGTRMFSCQQVDAIGTGGSIHIPLPFNAYDDVPMTMTVTTGIGERIISFDPADQYRIQFDAFSDAIRSGGPAPADPIDAVRNLAAMDAVFRSGDTGNHEKVETI